MAPLGDDADDAAREQAFRRSGHVFRGGLVRLTDWSGDDADPLLSLVEGADHVVLAVACSQRAWKGRPGLRPSLARLVEAVVRRTRGRALCLLLGSPGVLHDVSPQPPTLVSAWGDAPVSVRAALDVLLGGHPMRGLDPAP